MHEGRRRLCTLTWNCGVIQAYWTEVSRHISLKVEHILDPCPLMALLGYVKPLKNNMRRFAALSLLFAKRQISLKWGVAGPPTIRGWLKDLQTCNTASDDYATLLPVSSRPKNIWQPLKDYLHNFPITDTMG